MNDRVRRFVVVLLLLLVVGPVHAPDAAAVVPTCSSSTVTVTRVSSPVLYTDVRGAPLVDSAYEAYRVSNPTGGTHPDVWVTSGSFDGPTIGLAPREPGRSRLGDLAPGATRNAYFYLTAAGATVTTENHVISVYTGRPGLDGVLLCTTTVGLTTESDTDANANKVTSVSTSPAIPRLGGTLDVTVTGNAGTIGAAGIFATSPASLSGWPADAFRLTGVTLTLASGTYTDVLYLSGLTTASNGVYTAVFRFQVIGSTGGASSVSPLSHISSGNLVKHTDTGDFTALAPIPAVANTTTLAAQVSPASVPGGGTTSATVTVTNTGPIDVDVDDVVVAVTGVTYVGGTGRWTGVAAVEPTVAGSTVTFGRRVTVPAGGSRTLVLDLSVPATPGTYTATVVGHIGVTQIDTSVSTTSDSPAALAVTVPDPNAPANTAPAFTAAPTNDRQDVSVGDALVALAATDAEDDPLTFAVTGGSLPLPLNPDGTFTGTTAAEGSWTATVTVTDTGGASATTALTVEVTTPPAIAVTTSFTADPTPDLVGTTDATVGSTVTVTVDGQTLTGTVQAGGAWTVTAATLADGAYPLTASVTDPTGTGTASATLTVDTSPPVVTITGGPAVRTGDATPTIAGTTDALVASVVTVAVGGQTLSTTVQAGGGWTVTAATLPDELYPVTVSVTDATGTGTAEQLLTVDADPAPPVSTINTGTTPQTVTVEVPPGGDVSLVDELGLPTLTRAAPGQGTYTLDQDASTITFQPVLGFWGSATPVSFRVTGAGVSRLASYTAVVNRPAPPAVPGRTTVAPGYQTTEVPLPPGGSLVLLDGSGDPVASVTVPDQGTYTVVDGGALGVRALAAADTATIGFLPVAGFTGTADPVRFRVTDAYGQTAEAEYVPTVPPGSSPPDDQLAVTGTGVAGLAATGLLLLVAGVALVRRAGAVPPRRCRRPSGVAAHSR